MSTQNLARQIVSFSYDRIPPEALHEAKRSFLNWLGCAVGSHEHPAVDAMLSAEKLIHGRPQATFLGTSVRADLQFAAMLNGMSSSMYDYDDTLLDTVIHPSVPIFPALLAWYEYHRLPCSDFLNHFIVGVEAEERVGLFLTSRGCYEKGWHITPVAGAFGAAAAIGRVLSLSEEEMANAIGIVCSQPTGIRLMFGTYTKPLHAGKAAANGMLSALLARGGMTSSPVSLEAKRGFGFLLSDSPDPKPLEEAWDGPLMIMKNTYKPFACGIVAHPAIDGAIRIRRQGIDPEHIEKVFIGVHPLALELTGRPSPRDQLEAIFSVYHGVAVGLLEGKGGQWQFSDKKVRDEKVTALRQKVEAAVDDALGVDQARVRVVMDDGSSADVFVEETLGSLQKPLSDQDIEEKFCDLVSPYVSPRNREKIISAVWDLERQGDIRGIVSLCRSGG